MLAVAACVLVFVRGNVDYFEDVLQSTETAQEQRDALKKAADSGMMTTNNGKKRKYKVRTTGIRRGWGANTFFYKHLCEARRRSRIPFVDSNTIILVLVNLGMAFILSHVWSEEGDVMPAGLMMIIGAAFSCYILFFLNAAGAWMQELMKPYIYLVPASGFTKLVWAAMVHHAQAGGGRRDCIRDIGHLRTSKPVDRPFMYPGVCQYGRVVHCGQRPFRPHSRHGGEQRADYDIVHADFVAVGFAGRGDFPGPAAHDGRFPPPIVIGMPVVLWNLAVSAGVFALCLEQPGECGVDQFPVTPRRTHGVFRAYG